MTTEQHGPRVSWETTARLLKLGESITFSFRAPLRESVLEVFPLYLERADPGDTFRPGGDLGWLDALERESLPLRFQGDVAAIEYQPAQAGSYLARWKVAGDVLYRYFAAIEDDWVVVRFSPFHDLFPAPDLHACGIPVDYRLPVESELIQRPGAPGPDDCFREGSATFQALLSFRQRFGDGLVPQLPDTPGLDSDARTQLYARLMAVARDLVPGDVRSARIDAYHDEVPAYIASLQAVGVNDFCGLWEANCPPWLGMPEFPYFAAAGDYRRSSQGDSHVVAHQWDFCGGYHFLGPIGYQYGAAGGDWEQASRCMDHGLREAENMAALSGHPACLHVLYDGQVAHRTSPDEFFPDGFGGDEMRGFVEAYQRHLAFTCPKNHRVVFARSIDIADYYIRHCDRTPRTVFVSSTDHIAYDKWWLGGWAGTRQLTPRARLPWQTRTGPILESRASTAAPGKDPMSLEYLLLEDHRRSLRFERACPNPIWWFDYAHDDRWEDGTGTWFEAPEVRIVRKNEATEAGTYGIDLEFRTDSPLKDYAIVLWGIPLPFVKDAQRIRTNADEAIPARNVDGEFHLILCFDLVPGLEINVRIEI